MMKKLILSGICLLFLGAYSQAQYNACAAQSIVKETFQVERKDAQTGKTVLVEEQREVKNKDGHGNAKGNQYDLAVDGAFEGQTIVVLNLVSIDLTQPKMALQEKGFSMYSFTRGVPTAKQLKEALDKSCQLWVISSSVQQLNEDHAELIGAYFNSGKGVYIWGDNTPLHADADFLTQKLLGVTMSGTYMGDQTVGFKDYDTKSGMKKDHLITTGLEYVYEGITISQIHDQNQQLTPLITSTDGNMVAGIYERDGKRLIIDGGFTRLFYKWDSAGTGRYVKNAAAWLVNYERFGEDVLGDNIK